MVALLWYIPLVLEWNAKRVCESDGDRLKFQAFSGQVLDAVETILGVP